MKKRIDPDTLRNTSEAYALPLERGKHLYVDVLKRHIDSETLQYKQWHICSLMPSTISKEKVQIINSNGSISFTLTVGISNNELHISCNCNRRVEKLCHHAYHALKYLVAIEGEKYFATNIFKIEMTVENKE